MTATQTQPVLTDHARVRWRQRFGGADIDAAFARAVPVRVATLRAEARAVGMTCRLKPGGSAFLRDGETGAVFILVTSPDGRHVMTTVVRWRFGDTSQGEVGDG